MSKNLNQKTDASFFTTLPGILAGIAAVITAIGGIYIATRSVSNSNDGRTSTSPVAASTIRSQDVTPLTSPHGSSSVATALSNDCFKHHISGIPEERQRAIESGNREVVLVKREQQPKDGPLGIKLLEHGQAIGAIRFNLFSSADLPIFKDIKLYNASCQEIEDYSNKTRGGDKHVINNWDELRAQLNGRTYDLRLAYDENGADHKGAGEVKADFLLRSP